MVERKETTADRSVKESVFQLNLLENALDFILSAAEFAQRDDPRGWKYSVLHLADGLELLLKARLELEHWSLLFRQVDQASQDNLNSGDFESVDFSSAYTRLKKVVKVTIQDSDWKHLDDLRKRRNRIRHYTVQVDLHQVRSVVANCMNFCIEFSKDQGLSDHDASVQGKLTEVHNHLNEFQEFVDARLKAIAPELDQMTNWDCPECWQHTVPIGEESPVCRFCGYTISPTDLAAGNSEGDVEDCPECHGESTVGFILYNNDDGAWMCFLCGVESDDFQHCFRCGRLYSPNSPASKALSRCEDCVVRVIESSPGS